MSRWVQRPPFVRIVIAACYTVATAGLLILAFNPDLLFDRWAIVGASIVTLLLLTAILITGRGALYLGVAAGWLYAAVIEMLRGPTDADRAGLALVFTGLAIGALAAYTAWRREAPLRV